MLVIGNIMRIYKSHTIVRKSKAQLTAAEFVRSVDAVDVSIAARYVWNALTAGAAEISRAIACRVN